MIYDFDDFTLDPRRFELRPRRTYIPRARGVRRARPPVKHPDRLVTKDELLESVWGDKFVSEAALNSRVMSARKAVGDSGKEQRLIRTIHGRGFRFAGEVRPRSDGDSGREEEAKHDTATTAARWFRLQPAPLAAIRVRWWMACSLAQMLASSRCFCWGPDRQDHADRGS
jgi:DNA-binding winged helix-turn-helix (wHTH) protein